MKNMKHKLAFAVCVLLAAIFAAGCSQTQTPYEINDGDNFAVSVKYDANGGTFTTNTTVIVDSYNLSDMKTNSEGKAEIALLAPEDAQRGKSAFTAINNGYFLAGWYAQRTETGTDEAGKPIYSYGGKWDFADDKLQVDAAGEHTAAEPVLTLYAAWVPLFEVRFLDLATGEQLDTYSFNPTTAGDIQIPHWDTETGALELYDFPARPGYTFNAAYFDAAGTQAVAGETLAHPGTVSAETAQAENTVLDIYVDWMDGEWYHIYTAQQFLDNASVNGSYILHEDLDFAGKIWPTALMYGSYSGTIQGGGHTISNVTIEQTNNSKTNAGLFGTLTETAAISDLKLENITFTVKSGTRMAGTCYGLLSGTVAPGAALEGVELSGTLQIDSGAYFGTDDYTIGLVCGMGQTAIDASAITCTAVGASPETIVITVTDGTVTVSPASE